MRRNREEIKRKGEDTESAMIGVGRSGARRKPSSTWRKERKEGKENRKRKERGEGTQGVTWRDGFFSILMVVQNFGVADAASDNVQNRGRKLEEILWEKEVVRTSWAEKKRGKFQEQGRGKNRSEIQQPSKKVRCTSAWCTERMYMRRGDGGAVQQRIHAGMEVCGWRGKDH